MLWSLVDCTLTALQCSHPTLGNSFPPSLLRCSPAGVFWMWMISFNRSSSGRLAQSITDVSFQWMGWWLPQVCSATTDFCRNWVWHACGKSYIHRQDQAKAGIQAEGAPGCMPTPVSAVAEHAWGSHHPINWTDTSVIDRARRPEVLLLKEAIHIQSTPAGEHLNRDGGREIPRVGWLH